MNKFSRIFFSMVLSACLFLGTIPGFSHNTAWAESDAGSLTEPASDKVSDELGETPAPDPNPDPDADSPEQGDDSQTGLQPGTEPPEQNDDPQPGMPPGTDQPDQSDDPQAGLPPSIEPPEKSDDPQPIRGAEAPLVALSGEGYLPDHLIINQAAGIGDVANDSNPGAIEYSFVELYNPTDALIDISGYSLQYAESGDQWEMIKLEGEIPAKHSYLVRANGPSPNAQLFISEADLMWEDLIISNRSFKFALVDHQNPLAVQGPTAADGVIDLVGADNPSNFADFWEGSGAVGKMSKQQSARRQNFADYDQNWYDFVSIDYRTADIETFYPRTLGDGAWGEDLVPIPPPPVTDGTIDFDYPAGIYNASFYLTLTASAPGLTLLYTLDGSDPTIDPEAEGCFEYTAPLEMKDRTSDPEVLASLTGTTGPRNEMGVYDRNLIEQGFKGTVVKAQLFNADGSPASKVYVNSYFVNQDISALYGDLPIISVTTPVDYLFDPDIGIFVKGANGDAGPFNFDQKGGEWERPVYFEMFDPNNGEDWETTAAVSQGMGVRIHGGASRHFPQKSLRFYARSNSLNTNAGVLPVYDGKGTVDYDLFDGTSKDANGNPIKGGFGRFLLRAYGNDAGSSYIRDAVSNRLALNGGADIENQNYRPAAMFINGEFWGLYELTERYDEQYLTQHYGGNSNNYSILENPSPGHPNLEDNAQGDIDYFEAAVKAIRMMGDMNTPEAYGKILEYIDEDSLIDYVIIETLGGNLDWVKFDSEWMPDGWSTPTGGALVYHGNNQRIWRYTGPPTSEPGQDGKYRWMLYDTDKSWGYMHGGENNDAAHNTVEDGLTDNLFFFNALWQNDAFRMKFLNRYMETIGDGGWLSLSALQNTVNEVAGGISAAVAEQKKRWPYSLSASEWANEITRINNWMAQRVDPNSAFVRALESYIEDISTIYIAAYVDEPASLPENIDWDGPSITAFTDAKAYDSVKLTGKVKDTGYEVTAIVEVIPKNLVYFIDAGTNSGLRNSEGGSGNTMNLNQNGDWLGSWPAPDGSSAYDSISAKLAQSGQLLINRSSDRQYDEDAAIRERWGLADDTWQAAVVCLDDPLQRKLSTGYVGWDNRPEYAGRNMYVEYKLYLPVGEYIITTGHYCWWNRTYNPDGGLPRTMEVLFNNISQGPEFSFNAAGQSATKTYTYSQTIAGELSIKVNSTDGDGATLSFIGVQAVGEIIDDDIFSYPETIYRAVYEGEENPLSEPITVAYLNKFGTAEVEWDALDYTSLKNAEAYSSVVVHGKILGDESMPITAIVEVIPEDLVYFIDAGTIKDLRNNGAQVMTTYAETTDDGLVYHSGPGPESSLAYDAVKAKLGEDGKTLLNKVSDQLYNGIWGLDEQAYQFPVAYLGEQTERKLSTGYVGWDTWEGYEDKNHYIEYKLDLPEGDYIITTGHYCWWSLMYDGYGNPNGGFPRTMEIQFNGEYQGKPFTLANFGDNKVITHQVYHHQAGGELSIKIFTTGGDGAVLSFIGAQKVDLNEIAAYTVTFDADNGTENRIITVREGMKAAEPKDPVKEGFVFAGWYKGDDPFDFDTAITENTTLTAKWDEFIDYVTVITSDMPLYLAAYVGGGDLAPVAVDAEFASGKTGQAYVEWDETELAGLASAEAYSTVRLTGAVGGDGSPPVTADVEIIPRDLVYFIDAGTAQLYPNGNPQYPSTAWWAGDGSVVHGGSGEFLASTAYPAVVDRLKADGHKLYNGLSDQAFDGAWGVTHYWFPVNHLNPLPGIGEKLASGYVGNALVEGEERYVEYQIWLPAGEYNITTGHYCWWDPTFDPVTGDPNGGYPRKMEILFNDEAPDGSAPFEFSLLGENKVFTYPYIQDADGYMTIKSQWAGDEDDYPDDATLSFIGVEYVGGEDFVVGLADGPEVYAAAYVGEEGFSPGGAEVRYASGKTETWDVDWDESALAGLAGAEAYDTVSVPGVAESEGTIFDVTAIIEVIPENLVYFIDAAAFPGADKNLSWAGGLTRCFVEALDGVPDRQDEWKLGTNGSPAYDSVSARLAADGAPLRNGAADQFYDGSTTGWGVNPDTYQFTVELINPELIPTEPGKNPPGKKFVSGYVGFDNVIEYVDKDKYIEYSLYLPKGEYEITTGHFDWWGDHGGNPRAMNILFDDELVYGPIEFGTFMDNETVTINHIQTAAGVLNIKIEAIDDTINGVDYKDGAALTFIGVEKTGNVSDVLMGLTRTAADAAAEEGNQFMADSGVYAEVSNLTAWNNNQQIIIGYRGSNRTPIVINNDEVNNNTGINDDDGWRSVGDADIDTGITVDTATAFQIQLSTVGYENIRFSASQKSTGSGPESFALAYSIGSPDGPYTPIADSKVNVNRVGDNTYGALLPSYLSFELPAEIANQAVVYIRVYMVDCELENRANGNTSINDLEIIGDLINDSVVDKTLLAALIAEALELEEADYTSDSWAALEEALAAAQDVNADNNAAQSEVGVAASKLFSAMRGLVRLITATKISITPTHAILANTSDKVEFTAVLEPENSNDFSNIVWSIVGDPGDVIITSTPSADKHSVVVSASGTFSARTMVVKAVYDGKYTATATVEILPGQWTLNKPTVKVLEKTVTVNRAKVVSARVPILITEQKPEDIGVKAFGAGQGAGLGALDEVAPVTPGAISVGKVRLMTKDKKGNWNEVDRNQFTAGLCPTDDRYIEIYATLQAKTKKNVRVDLLPADAVGVDESDGQWINATSLTKLSVVEKYPKITFTYENLNLFYNVSGIPTTKLTAKAADGSVAKVEGLAYAASKYKKIVNIKGEGENLMLEAIKKGTAKLKVSVSLDGYNKEFAAKKGKKLNASVKVTNSLPKLKLSKSSVPLLKADSEPTYIQLLTGDKKVPFESTYKVNNVTCSNGLVDVDYDKSDGTIKVTPNTKTKKGTANLAVTFDESTKTVKLKLKITKAVAASGVKASVKTKALTVQMGHDGKIADIPITLNVSNLAPTDWHVGDVTKGNKATPEWPAAQPVSVVPGANMVTLNANGTMLANLMEDGKDSKGNYKNLKYNLFIESSQVQAPVKIAVTITANKPSFTVARKGKVDLAVPDSAITATVKLKNAASEIEYVKLLDKAGGPESPFFEAELTGANTFTVKIKDGGTKPAPGVTKKPVVEIKLANEPTTMTKAISIVPKQTKGKKTQDKSKITLYKSQPLQGETVKLNLKAPVSLGAAQIRQASLNKMKFDTGGFELVRCGENDWTIVFKDDKAPTKIKKKNGKDVLKSSYTLQLELWAEGTYNTVTNPDGSVTAQPVKEGKKASKPTIVKVKVYIK